MKTEKHTYQLLFTSYLTVVVTEVWNPEEVNLATRAAKSSIRLSFIYEIAHRATVYCLASIWLFFYNSWLDYKHKCESIFKSLFLLRQNSFQMRTTLFLSWYNHELVLILFYSISFQTMFSWDSVHLLDSEKACIAEVKDKLCGRRWSSTLTPIGEDGSLQAGRSYIQYQPSQLNFMIWQ